MILIADSGSSKTDWRIIEQGKCTSSFQTVGINPYYQQKDDLVLQVKHELEDKVGEVPERLFFYGAGCATITTRKLVSDIMFSVFPGSHVEVASDLLGAARSLCFDDEGIVCILGTGSNSCLYDGSVIIDHIPPLGYILGDEGGGAYLGKRIISDYFKRIMPLETRILFEEKYQLNLDLLYDNLFKQPYPNRYLATFSSFIVDCSDDAWCSELLYDSFIEFFERNVKRYEDFRTYKLYFTGSIAMQHQRILREVAARSGLYIAGVTAQPADGLAKYHIEKGS